MKKNLNNAAKRVQWLLYIGRPHGFIMIWMFILLLPVVSSSQQVTLSGNVRFFVANSQPFKAPDGFLMKDNAVNSLPATLPLNSGDVVLSASTALYRVHSVPASGDAVFYSALLSGNAALTVKNSASGVSDFSLKLESSSVLGSASVPVVWEVSQTSGSGVGDLVFSWDASLETSTLSNKRLYVYSSGAWTVLPLANTTVGTYSLTYSGYNSALSSTRFGIATGLSATVTPTDPLCAGGTGSISVSASGGLGTRSYKLGTGTWQSSNQFTGLAAGSYTIYTKDAAGDEVSEMITLTDPPPTTASVTGDLNICPGESTTLTASGGATYSWNGSLGTNAAITVSPTTNTTYSVTVTDANGCIATNSKTVQIYTVQPPVVSYTDNSGSGTNDGIICAGSGATIALSGGVSYSWSDGSTASSRALAPACTAPYSVTTTDANGCTGISSLQLSVNYTPSITQITPSSGNTGTTINVYGKDLDNISQVRFNGQAASSLTIVSSTQLTASLPASGVITQVTLVSPCGTITLPVNTPAITSFTPGAGSVGTIITLNGTNLDQLVSASVGGVSAAILSRSATAARVLVMPGAATGNVSVTNALTTASASSVFTVNSTPYPYFQQGTKLTNNSTNAIQGSYVSVSADGNTAIVGAPGDNSGVGAAWIYVRSGNTWSQQAKLVGTGAAGMARQGTGVAISSDGNTAVVGGPDDNSKAGAVWVFTRSGTTWTQQGNKLTGSGAIGAAQQGISVAVSGDGNTVASGGFADDNYTGAVWTFARYGNSWAQLGDKIKGSGSSGAARQGAAVSLNGRGTRMIVGGYQDNNRQGAVWVFDLNNCNWSQQGSKLVGTGGTSQAWQGYSVSLSADGNTAVVGGNSDNNLAGAVWVYTYSGSAWAQQARLAGTQAAGAARQGNSVALSADGNTIMVGGSGDDSGKGAVWVYRKNGSSWVQQGAKVKGSGAVGAAKQGSAVSLSANGTTGVIGGPADNVNKGAFWVYIPATNVQTVQQALSEDRTVAVSVLRLDQNIPNPFTGNTNISFSVPEACMAEWEITDVSGQVVQVIRRNYPAGEHTETFDFEGLSGLFYYRLKTPFGTAARKMLIVD